MALVARRAVLTALGVALFAVVAHPLAARAEATERPRPANYRFADRGVVLFVPGGANPEYREGDRLVALAQAPQSSTTFISGIGEGIEFLRGGRAVRVVARDGTVRLGRRVKLYREEDVRFANANVTLAGTLLLPRGRGPHPAVVLASGAGRTTRAELWWTADDLARRGIAALVYDKRGAGESGGSYGGAVRDYGALAGDVLAATRLLKARPDIDGRWIGVRGASEGGWVAPLAAARSSDIAFVIAVAAPGDPARQALWSIHNHLRYADLPRDAYELSELATILSAGLARALGVLPPCCRHASFPAPAWQRVDQPVLLIYGGLDREVPPALSARTITGALRRGGNTDYTVRLFPRANHAMFRATKGGFAAELEGWRTARLEPGYVETIAEWMEATIAGARRKARGWRPRGTEPISDVARPAWHAGAPVQLALWTLFGTVFGATLAQRLAARLLARRRKPPASPLAPRVRRVRLLAAVTSGVGIAVLTGIVLVFAQFASGAPSRTAWAALRALAASSAVLTLALMIGTRRAWKEPGWSRRARLRHSAVTAAATAFVPFLVYWQLLG